MVRRRESMKLLCTGLLVIARPSWGQTGGRLAAILESFKRQSTAGQYKQVSEAIAASPTLAHELGAAADGGRLTGITVAAPSYQPSGPFRTTVEKSRIVFAADFLPQVLPRRLYDVVQPDDLLPNNLVFVLGAFAFWLQPPAARSTADMNSFIQAHVERDARAFLNGWNDMIEAATRDNGNKPPTPRQISSLLMNLRYRALFIGDAMKKLQWANSGRLEPTAGNVGAVAEVLRKMKLLDFGSPPEF
jgi:hypothetical protein